MKKLILMCETSDSDNSHLIKLNLKNNILSTESFKIMLSGMELTENGPKLSQKNNIKAFNMFFDVLEERMQNGLLTVVKCDSIEKQFDRYRVLCQKYRYECILIGSNLELNKKFNFVKTIKIEKLAQEVQLKYQDISRYKKVIHIGDIHGCYSVLREAIRDVRFDNFYIFHGDYLDRGIENAATLKYILKLRKKPNVVFLKGNHEFNLIRYSNGEETYGKVFEKTKAEIEEAHISIRDIKDFCNQLQNYFAYQYKNKKVFCTHGGISSLKDISLVSELSFVVGSDSFDSDIDKLWEKNVENVYQVHGHRNENNAPILASINSFNLEGAVEFGGSLRVLELNSHFHTKNLKNKVYSNEYEDVESAVNL